MWYIKALQSSTRFSFNDTLEIHTKTVILFPEIVVNFEGTLASYVIHNYVYCVFAVRNQWRKFYSWMKEYTLYTTPKIRGTNSWHKNFQSGKNSRYLGVSGETGVLAWLRTDSVLWLVEVSPGNNNNFCGLKSFSQAQPVTTSWLDIVAPTKKHYDSNLLIKQTPPAFRRKTLAIGGKNLETPESSIILGRQLSNPGYFCDGDHRLTFSFGHFLFVWW